MAIIDHSTLVAFFILPFTIIHCNILPRLLPCALPVCPTHRPPTKAYSLRLPVDMDYITEFGLMLTTAEKRVNGCLGVCGIMCVCVRYDVRVCVRYSLYAVTDIHYIVH